MMLDYKYMVLPSFKHPFYLSPKTDILVMESIIAMKDFNSEDIRPWSHVENCCKALAINPHFRSFHDYDYWDFSDLGWSGPPHHRYPGDTTLEDICAVVKRFGGLTKLFIFYDFHDIPDPDHIYAAKDVGDHVLDRWNKEKRINDKSQLNIVLSVEGGQFKVGESLGYLLLSQLSCICFEKLLLIPNRASLEMFSIKAILIRKWYR